MTLAKPLGCAVVSLSLLGGCSSSDFAALQERATAEIKGAKDNEARLLIDGAGAVGLRAWSRLTNPMEQCGLLLLSGIPCQYSGQGADPPRPVISDSLLGQPVPSQ